MKSHELQQGNWRQGLAAACESLVHPDVLDEAARRMHARLIGMLFCAPILGAALLVQILHDRVSPMAMAAMICAVLAAGWLGAAAAAGVRATDAAITVALAVLAGLVGIAVAGGGVLASPLALLLLALPFEAWWLGRSDARTGWLMAAGGLAVAAILGPFVGTSGFDASLWLVPACHAATVWLRLSGSQPADGEAAEPAAQDPLAELARVSGSTVLNLDRRGHVETQHGELSSRLGIEPVALMGSGLFDRLHVTDRLFYLSTLDSVRASGKPAAVRLRARTATDGSGPAGHLLLEFVISPAPAGACIACVRDCAEIQALQARLEGAEARAEGFELAKGRFLATVSHELRTPLNAIIGFADMLGHEIAGPLPDRRQKDYVRLIGESGQHLLSVVNAILDVSRIESGNYNIAPEPFPVVEAVDMCLSMLGMQAQAKQIRLVADIAPSVGMVRADRRAVQQMLINLIANAVKFTPEGGRIEVAADASASHLVLRIRDNGIGMASADLERIGNPFIQLRHADQDQGSGLGLFLVKGLVALHEGSLEIDSAPSQGTAVTIRLPLQGPGGAPVHRLRMTNSADSEMERKDEAERRYA